MPNIKEHYDADNQLTLFTYNDRNSNEYQIHDFITGFFSSVLI
jgi:hypothetical protein